LSASTVRWHLENIYGKLHVGTRTAAVLKFHSVSGQKTSKP
jgi:ATP/maltotriose-dependent transcriptional regulator MalT